MYHQSVCIKKYGERKIYVYEYCHDHMRSAAGAPVVVFHSYEDNDKGRCFTWKGADNDTD